MDSKKKLIKVLIAEDNPYARDVMSMLLIRDWRTQVIGEISATEEVEDFLQSSNTPVDFLLIDTEHPGEPDWAFHIAARAREIQPKIGILFASTHANIHTLKRSLAEQHQGYILKAEVLYSLAWAVAAAAAGSWVTTPEIQQLAKAWDIELPLSTMVFDGTIVFDHLRPRERDVARLAILFNLRRADIADELNISEGQVNKYVSTIYHILGLIDILTGADSASHYFSDENILARFNEARKIAANSKHGRAHEKATLAFHLLTMPTRENT